MKRLSHDSPRSFPNTSQSKLRIVLAGRFRQCLAAIGIGIKSTRGGECLLSFASEPLRSSKRQSSRPPEVEIELHIAISSRPLAYLHGCEI